MNERLTGLRPIDDAGAAVTVNVTGIEMGLAPVAASVMVAVWGPAESVPVATVTVTVLFPVPDAGLSVSQAALSPAVQLKVPPPVLLTLKAWLAGLPPPCCAVKVRLVGLAPMAGGTGAAVTVKVTGTETVVVPVALRETVVV